MSNSPFSWKSVFEGYTIKDFVNDSIPSIILSLAVFFISFLADERDCLYEYVKNLINVALTIIPVIASFVLAAYVLIQTFITSRDTSREYNTSGGRQLLQNINSSFAFCIIASIGVLLFIILIFLITQFGIAINCATWINRLLIVIIVYVLTYTIYIVKGVVADIFAFGQVSILKLSEPKDFYYIKQDSNEIFLVCLNWNYEDEEKILLLFEGTETKNIDINDAFVKEIGIYPTDQIPHPIGFKQLHANNKLYAEVKKRVQDITQ